MEQSKRSNVVIVSYLHEIPVYWIDRVESAMELEIMHLAGINAEGEECIFFRVLTDEADKYLETDKEVEYINSLSDVNDKEAAKALFAA